MQAGAGGARLDRGQRGRGRGQGVGEVGQQRYQRSRRGAQSFRRGQPRPDPAQRVDHRPVGQRFAQRVAGARQHPQTPSAQYLRRLRDQPGLADPRLALHQHHRRTHPGHRSQQRPQLGLPTGERKAVHTEEGPAVTGVVHNRLLSSHGLPGGKDLGLFVHGSHPGAGRRGGGRGRRRDARGGGVRSGGVRGGHVGGFGTELVVRAGTGRPPAAPDGA